MGRPAVLTDGNGNQTRCATTTPTGRWRSMPHHGASADPVARPQLRRRGTAGVADRSGRRRHQVEREGGDGSPPASTAGRPRHVMRTTASETWSATPPARRGVPFATTRWVGRCGPLRVGLGEGGRAERHHLRSTLRPGGCRRRLRYGTVELTSDALGRLVSESGPGQHRHYGTTTPGNGTLAVDTPRPPTIRRRRSARHDRQRRRRGDSGAGRRGRCRRLAAQRLAASYGYDDAGRLAAMRYAIDDESLGGVDTATTATGAASPPRASWWTSPCRSRHRHRPRRRKTADVVDVRHLRGTPPATGDEGTAPTTWDARGQLASVTGPVSATFGYDPFGRRVSQTVRRGHDRVVHDGSTWPGSGPATTSRSTTSRARDRRHRSHAWARRRHH